MLCPRTPTLAQVRADSNARAADSTIVVSPAARGAARTPVERRILELERASDVAYVRKDTAAFGRYLAPDYREFAPDGHIRGRAAALAAIANDTMRITSASLDTASIRVQGDAAVVLAALTMRGAPGAQSSAARLWYTDTWARRGGRWLLVASQFQMAQPDQAMGYAPSNQSSMGASPAVRGDSAASGADAAGAMETAATLRRLEIEWADAAVRRDSATLARFEAPDAVFTYPDGATGTSADDIRSIMTGVVIFDSVTIDSVRVRPLGTDAAIVTGRAVNRARMRSSGGQMQDISGTYRFQDVWQQRDGRWQIRAAQVTRVAAPQQ
jgi:uncharacterized protein (TIGR02246 family)